MRKLPLFFLGLVVWAVAAWAQGPGAPQTNPGRLTYDTRCARCHGGAATGGESGPNIVAKLGPRHDPDLATFLRAGKPATGMPAFDLAATEMNGLVQYLRTLTPTSRA